VLSKLHCPLASIFIPIATNNLGVECHIFAEVEGFANFVEVLPDIRRVASISGPVWTNIWSVAFTDMELRQRGHILECKIESVCV
jgi:hypothetical protein